MDKRLKQLIHDVLWDILDNRQDHRGICAFIDDAVYDSCNDRNVDPWGDVSTVEWWLTAQFIKWPYYSGDGEYPVPCPEGEFPESPDWHRANEAYWGLNRWEGKYGESRIQLVMFLLQQLDLTS